MTSFRACPVNVQAGERVVSFDCHVPHVSGWMVPATVKIMVRTVTGNDQRDYAEPYVYSVVCHGFSITECDSPFEIEAGSYIRGELDKGALEELAEAGLDLAMQPEEPLEVNA